MKNPKLVIVTDLGLLRAYRRELTPKGTPRLELIEEFHFDDAHAKVKDKVTDLAGRRTSGKGNHAGTPVADSHNLRLEIRRRLIRQIAAKIKALIQRSTESGVWLAAPKEINHLILDELPVSLRPRIEVNLARDLTKVDKKELLESFPRPELDLAEYQTTKRLI
ncbi:MAG: host attachment protein, partial [Verrucomicrobiae bacterium]|nr:host attachment protein [Verrucomicrobiae bacterium]